MTLPNFGLVGKMGSGKDTVADYLINTSGYVPLAFATPLKDMVIEADPLISYDGLGTFSPVPVHLSDILNSGRDFEWCKRAYPEVRRSLQRIGQGIRKIDPDYWVRSLFTRALELPESCPIVVTDVRYRNEADQLRMAGFILIRVTRERQTGMTMEETRAALHESETALDNYQTDHTIRNDGTLRDLADKIVELF